MKNATETRTNWEKRTLNRHRPLSSNFLPISQSPCRDCYCSFSSSPYAASYRFPSYLRAVWYGMGTVHVHPANGNNRRQQRGRKIVLLFRAKTLKRQAFQHHVSQSPFSLFQQSFQRGTCDSALYISIQPCPKAYLLSLEHVFK